MRLEKIILMTVISEISETAIFDLISGLGRQMADTYEIGAALPERQGPGGSVCGDEFGRGNEGNTEDAPEQQSHNQHGCRELGQDVLANLPHGDSYNLQWKYSRLSWNPCSVGIESVGRTTVPWNIDNGAFVSPHQSENP